MTVVLVLPNGEIIRDSGWQTVGDVMAGFAAFGTIRAYGQVQTEDGVPLTEMLPFPTT